MTDVIEPVRSSYRQVLAEPRFRVLFATRSLAIGADTFRTVALATLIFNASGSAVLAALTFGVSYLAQLVGGVLLGAAADRLPPRAIIATAYLLEAVVAATLALGHMCLALVGVVACGTPIFAGASSKLVAEVLTGDAYVLGRSLWNVAASIAQLLGMAGGGIAVAALGPRSALLFTAGCYLVSATALRFGLPDVRVSAATASGRASVIRQSWQGNRTLVRNRAVRTLLLAQCLPPAFVTGAESLIIPYTATRHFPHGSARVLLACVPAGMMLGNIIISRLIGPARRERFTVLLMLACGVPLLPLAVDPPVVVIGVLMLVVGCGFAYSLGRQRRFLDVTPVELRGEAFGLLQTAVMTLQGLGPLALGSLTLLLPAGSAMAVAGGLTCLTALLFRLSASAAGVGGPTRATTCGDAAA